MVSSIIPSGLTSTWAGTFLSIAIASYALSWVYLYATQSSKEPPLAPCAIPIPFIGPIIEMRMKKSKFPIYMKSKFPQPIYTVRVPGKRFYFVNSTALIPVIQRQVRILSFDPPLINGVRSILGVSPTTVEIMGRGVAPGADDAFLARLNKEIHPPLSAGPMLDAMNDKVMQILDTSLSAFAAKGETTVSLYDWVRKMVMVATTDTVFGPKNPFRDPANITAWIEFETNGMPLLALDALPDWAIGEGLRAREVLVRALDQYLADKGETQGSEFIQRRIRFYRKEGLPANDVARLAVADNIAFSSNLIPTEFWLLYHIFSDPVVLQECRDEVTKTVREQNGRQIISHAQIKNACPVLQSTFREVFRLHGFGLVPRRALADHMLDGKYLIKKEGTVFTPYRVQHHDAVHWGANHTEFDHRRFIRAPGEKRHDPAALRGFGYGAHLCPGRHFAGAEILLFTAMMILRFDAAPVEGRWPTIPVERSSQVAAVDQPDHDVEVRFRPREGVRQEGWGVDFSGFSEGLKEEA